MWELVAKADKTKELRLVLDKEYIVGRKDCAILIKDDPSISRKHAVISLSYNIAELGDPSKLPDVLVKDTSKYGVTVNGTKIESGSSQKLNNGDEILFGTHNSVYRLSYNKSIFVASCLDSNQKKILKKQIHKMGGHLLSEWKHGYSTYLVMEGLTFTVKVIHALANCCPIVTPEFVDEIIKSAEENLPLPDSSRFLPPVKEETIISDGPKFLPNPKRKELFRGKIFIFLSKKQYKRTYESIERCGGKTSLLESADESVLVQDRTCVMMVDAKERESLPPETKRIIAQTMDILKTHKKRPIPESELGLAILQMSLDKYCNANLDAVPLLTQNVVCQSLQLGPEEMSQVFSQQHGNEKEFKKPETPGKTHPTKLPAAKTDAKTSVMETILETQTQAQVTPARQKANGVKREAIAETQNDSQTPKRLFKKCDPRPPSNDTSGGNDKGSRGALVADTPLDESNHEKTTPPKLEKRTDSPIQQEFREPSRNSHTIAGDDSTSKRSLVVDTPLDETVNEKTKSPKLGDQRTVLPESELNVSHSVVDIATTNGSKTSKPPKLTHKAVPRESGIDVPHKKADPIVLDTLDHSSCRKKSEEDVFAVPESMDIEGVAGGRAQRESSSSSEVESGWKSSKRVRSDSNELGLEVETRSPFKRARNWNREEHGNISDGKEHKASTRNGDEWQDSTESQRGLMNPRRTGDRPAVLPDGFLSARAPRKPIAKLEREEDEEDGLLRNLVVVDEVSLVVRRPQQRTNQQNTATDSNVKNFKKFRKQWYPGCSSAFPRIIGGSDLVVFENSSGVEQEDWFIEAREVDAEQERLDRQAERLFMMEPQVSKRRKR